MALTESEARSDPPSSSSNAFTRPTLGFGAGLRVAHNEAILAGRPAINWFEVHTENLLVAGSTALHHLTRIRERYPIVMRGLPG